MLKEIAKKLFNGKKTGGGAAYLYSPGGAVWMQRDYKKFAEEAYVKNVIAHRAISMISQAASSIPLLLYRQKGSARYLLEQHALLNLLRKPNPIQSGSEFLESIYSYKQLAGNAYILAVCGNSSQPVELYALRPDRVKVIAGDHCMPLAYEYRMGKDVLHYPVDPISGLSSILHLKNFNPLSDWYGLSSIEAASYSIDQHNQAGQWNQSLLQNGARPSGAIIVRGGPGGSPSTLTQAQYSELRRTIDTVFSGPQNAGRPILLEGGLDWKEMSLSPKDMDFIASKHSSARDIALALGMPPQLLGIPGDNTYSNLQEARLALWEQTIIPLVDNVISNLGNWLCRYWGAGLELSYNLDSISALASRRHEIWERVERCSFLTVDEKRASVGLTPLGNNVGGE